MIHGIKFTKKLSGYCDFCGLATIVLESESFDNGNASETTIRICRCCARNIDNLFEMENPEK